MDTSIDRVYTPSCTRGYEWTKRLGDFLVAAVLLVALSPIMVLIGLAIRFTSPGPAVYRQERVGRRGRVFLIWKYRTMHSEPCTSGPLITSGDDERVTRLGRVLRKTKLDEFPQLVNVLRGEMSFVGPRPQVPRFVEKFPEPYRSVILSVRPGITGPTQLEFRHEEDMLKGYPDPELYYVRCLLPEKCRMDSDYVMMRSLRYDLHVAMETMTLFLCGNARRFGGKVIGRSVLRRQPAPAHHDDERADVTV